jgi:hypothetical protein
MNYCMLSFLGFTTKENTNNTTVNSRNSPPNIESVILKKGSPDRTLFEGRANE